MRIIAGKHRSRKLNTLEGMNTRPTQDKIKEAMFSSVGTYFHGGNMLDLFAGSGSVALESISRGIEKAYLCDHSQDAIKIIKSNIALLNEEEHCVIFEGNYIDALNQWKDITFDFIFIDPPYANKVIEDCLRYIDENHMLNEYGLIAVESSKEDIFLEHYGNLTKKKEKCYGITRITYFKEDLKR